MWTVRIILGVIFFAAMFGVREVAHIAVDAGPFAWLALMGAIFGVGIWMENRDRVAAGRPSYSWSDARKDMLGPLSLLAAVLAVAYLVR